MKKPPKTVYVTFDTDGNMLAAWPNRKAALNMSGRRVFSLEKYTHVPHKARR